MCNYEFSKFNTSFCFIYDDTQLHNSIMQSYKNLKNQML